MPIVSTRCQFGCQVALLCLFWYSVSSAASVINKLTLQKYPYPMTVALASLVSIPLYSKPFIKFWQIKKYHLPSYYTKRYLIPISIGKAFAVASAYFSLSKVPISYAHTVKATMPLFAVICARVILNERQTKLVYISLIPIVIGVLIASLTELSFNFAGLISAIMSTFTYALLNVFVKRQTKASIQVPDVWFIVYLTISGLMSFCQNLCAFTLIHRLTALSYAVTNTTKRITVISVSLIMLRNPITISNAFGMLLAILGVFLYNQAKQQHANANEIALPLTHVDSTLSDASLLAFNETSLQLTRSASPRRHRLVDPNDNNHHDSFSNDIQIYNNFPIYIPSEGHPQKSSSSSIETFSSLQRDVSPRRINHVRFVM
ncbi:unnamed protein product [Anisakis simplex]|uniref:Solute carrier family 35 member E1 (inferred by orthology to a human protein) n=1 Tax=Anisakis simplex TaxID=6269 RepID=A0A0M3IYA2_ANISI|nr:unnamed protein product [Anisakis simplex]